MEHSSRPEGFGIDAAISRPENLLAELADTAIFIQNACNLAGVVHDWSRAISRLKAVQPELGTDKLSQHWLNVLYASKVASLTRCESTTVFTAAWDAAAMALAQKSKS